MLGLPSIPPSSGQGLYFMDEDTEVPSDLPIVHTSQCRAGIGTRCLSSSLT